MSTIIAVVQTLAFIGTVGLVLAAIGTAVACVLLRRGKLARLSMLAAIGLSVGYAALLVAVGVASPTRVIANGAAKRFCEVDCRVAYDVAAVYRETDSIAIVVQEAFEESTSASHADARSDARLAPGTRRFALVDRDGRRYRPQHVRMLGGDTLFGSLGRGDERRAELTFRVPRDVEPQGLLVEDGSVMAPLLIGHERSPFHGKTLLSLM